MTFFYFINCIALSVAPYYFFYRGTLLAEYGALWKCILASGAYVTTQMCKLLLQATFFPTYDVPMGVFDWTGEMLSSLTSVVDFVGIYVVMNQISGRGQLKFLAAGLGWSAAEFAFTRLWLLWSGARGIEFEWRFLAMALHTNLDLLQYVVAAMLIWLNTRHDLQAASRPLVTLLLALLSLKQFLLAAAMFHTMNNVWAGVICSLALTTFTGLLSLFLYLRFSYANAPQLNSHLNLDQLK